MLASAAADLPYCGAAPLPSELWRHWNFDPLLLAALGLAAVAWMVRAASSRRTDIAFWAGWATLAVAFVSPLCALSSGLFSVRSLHHLLIVAIAAPMLGHAVGVGRRLPLGLLLALHVGTFWAWHLPALYTAALANDLLYWSMQLSLLGSGVLFWSALFRGRNAASGIGALGLMIVQMGLLGAILTFATRALYAPHFLTAAIYGLTPLEDQQLAGLVMWVASLPLTMAAGLPILRRHLPLHEARA